MTGGGKAELLMSWLEWVEVQGVDDLVEGLHRLRGAVMVATLTGVNRRSSSDRHIFSRFEI